MIFKRALSFIAILVFAFLLYRCAQVVPLTGGSKDAMPPELLSVVPANKSTNIPVKNVRIVFKFNELVAAQNISQKLLINPSTSELPEVTANGKTVVVSFEKDLEPNTTYFLQFGNSIVDIHESNPYPNLSYVFSTGPVIDTAYITGTVSYALSQKPAADVSVGLYKDLSDSAPLITKPDYVTRTDEKGSYYLTAIKPGSYRVIAVSDKNKNQVYDISEAVGFLDAPIRINADTVNLQISTAKNERLFIKKKVQAFWGYNKYILNDTFPNAYIITEKSIDTDKYQYELRNDTLEVYYKDLSARDFEFVVKNDKQAYDTVHIEIPAKVAVEADLEKNAKKMSVRTEKSAYGIAHDPVILNFSLPLKDLDNSKCILFKDSVKEKPQFTGENVNEEGNLVTTYLPGYKKRLLNTLKPQTNYTLWVLPGAAQTFWGTYNADTLRTSFKTFPIDEKGNLLLKLTIPDTMKNYVLQLLTDKGIIVREYAGINKKDAVVKFFNLPAGDYLLRYVDDKDQNRKFSPASYLQKQQAETVYFYDKPIKIPAGWDVETEWKIISAQKK